LKVAKVLQEMEEKLQEENKIAAKVKDEVVENEMVIDESKDSGNEDENDRIPLDEQKEYMEIAKKEELCSSNVEEYFENEIAWDIGSTQEIMCRPGYDHSTRAWKFFVKKNNLSYTEEAPRPSVLALYLSEMKDLQDYLTTQIGEIKKSLEANEPRFKPDAGTKKLLPNEIEFWTDENFVWYSPSGSFRVRITWSSGNVYFVHVNVIKGNLILN